jgi:transposase InsO family protein
VWTYDFLEARTERGGKLRMLTILDEYTRECLTIHVARSVSSRQVIQQLEWLFLLRGAPDYLRSDKGPEFIAYALQQWLRDRHCNTMYITPGSPWENPFILRTAAWIIWLRLSLQNRFDSHSTWTKHWGQVTMSSAKSATKPA